MYSSWLLWVDNAEDNIIRSIARRKEARRAIESFYRINWYQNVFFNNTKSIFNIIPLINITFLQNIQWQIPFQTISILKEEHIINSNCYILVRSSFLTVKKLYLDNFCCNRRDKGRVPRNNLYHSRMFTRVCSSS